MTSRFPQADVSVYNSDVCSSETNSVVLTLRTRIPMEMFEDHLTLQGVIRQIGRELLRG